MNKGFHAFPSFTCLSDRGSKALDKSRHPHPLQYAARANRPQKTRALGIHPCPLSLTRPNLVLWCISGFVCTK